MLSPNMLHLQAWAAATASYACGACCLSTDSNDLSLELTGVEVTFDGLLFQIAWLYCPWHVKYAGESTVVGTKLGPSQAACTEVTASDDVKICWLNHTLRFWCKLHRCFETANHATRLLRQSDRECRGFLSTLLPSRGRVHTQWTICTAGTRVGQSGVIPLLQPTQDASNLSCAKGEQDCCCCFLQKPAQQGRSHVQSASA